MAWQMLLAFVVYLTTLLGIGLWAAGGLTKRKADKAVSDDAGAFLVGDRSLNYWVTALSAHASDMSSWIFMGLPSVFFLEGLPKVWIMVGLSMGMLLNWHYVAPALRRITEKLSCNTLASFFEKRFGDTSGALRSAAATMAIFYFIMYIAAELLSIGRIFEYAFELPYALGIIGGVAIMMIYTFVGGFVSVAFVDFFQGIFLLLMIMLVPAYVYMHIGGFEQLPLIAASRGVSLSLLPDFSWTSIKDAIFIALGWGLGYFGMPHILNKFMGIRNVDEMYKAKRIGIAWQTCIFLSVLAVAFVGIVYFPEGVDNSELIFVYLVKDFFAPFFAGLVLCGILAGIISTIDSQILVVASIFTDDVYKRWIERKATGTRLVQVFRLCIVMISIFSATLALYLTGTIYDLIWYAWTGLGCSFGPVVLLGLFSDRANKYGALAGILFGGLFAATWNPLLRQFFEAANVPAMIPGFFGSLFVILLVSKLTGGGKEMRAVRSS